MGAGLLFHAMLHAGNESTRHEEERMSEEKHFITMGVPPEEVIKATVQEEQLKADFRKANDDYRATSYLPSELEALKTTKHTKNRLFYELDWDFIAGVAKRMQIGKLDGKYQRFKWKEGIDLEEVKQATLRHVLEVLKGNYQDDGQEYGHIYAIVCNSMFIEHELKRTKGLFCTTVKEDGRKY